MKKKYTLLLYIATALYYVLTFLYLLKVYKLYDNSIYLPLIQFAILTPAIFINNIITTLKNKDIPTKAEPSESFYIIILIITILCCGYFLIKFPYQLITYIVLAATIIMLIIYFIRLLFIIINYEESSLDSPLDCFLSMFLICTMLLATTNVYLRVLAPLTVKQAQEIVNQTYGNGIYTYSTHVGDRFFDYAKDEPLGVYCFYADDRSANKDIAVTVLDGKIKTIS